MENIKRVDTQVSDASCPKCGMRADCLTSYFGARPMVGDVVICVSCEAVLEIEDEGLAPLTPMKIGQLIRDGSWARLNTCRTALKMVKSK